VTPELTLADQLDLALRLTVGLLLGAIIGFERELHSQPAGFRTHSVVALGAAIFTVVSAFAFTGPGSDPTRIAAQIVSGIGFIGAGTILHSRGQIRGLTTAASLWSVAGIGMAAGAGLYGVAVIGTVLMLVILSLFDLAESYARRRMGLGPDNRTPPSDADDADNEETSKEPM
jgi:putative Mg2+ transporter-C (MgtC) family protein